MLQHQPCRCLLSMSQRDPMGTDGRWMRNSWKTSGPDKARASITRSWNDDAYIVVQRGRCKRIRWTLRCVTELSLGTMMK